MKKINIKSQIKNYSVLFDNCKIHLEDDINDINIKATTTEQLGFIGRSEGIAAQAICLIHKD